MEVFEGARCKMLLARLKANHTCRMHAGVEKDPVARGVARQFIAKLLKGYPRLLPTRAVQRFDTRLPYKVESVGLTHMLEYMAMTKITPNPRDFIV